MSTKQPDRLLSRIHAATNERFPILTAKDFAVVSSHYHDMSLRVKELETRLKSAELAADKYLKQSKIHLRGQLTAEAELAQRHAESRS